MIRKMEPSDWNRVREIYERALLPGHSTFNTVCPEYEEWDRNHIKECRYVAVKDGLVIGWTAISPTSTREAYRGVVEESVYVDEAFQGQGVGAQLLNTLCEESRKQGYWCLYASVFSINSPSIALHKKCGFREVGYRERIAKDRFGNWQNTTIFEKRLSE